jgi:hypothetical protein
MYALMRATGHISINHSIQFNSSEGMESVTSGELTFFVIFENKNVGFRKLILFTDHFLQSLFRSGQSYLIP